MVSASTRRPTASTRPVTGGGGSATLATAMPQCGARGAIVGRKPPPIAGRGNFLVAQAVETADLILDRCARKCAKLRNQARSRRSRQARHATKERQAVFLSADQISPCRVGRDARASG